MRSPSRLTVAGLGLLLAALGAGGVSALQDLSRTASVFGTLVDFSSGEPVAHATVRLMRGALHGTERRQSETDGSGRFLAADLPAGDWLVEADATGYLDSSSAASYGLSLRTNLRLSVGDRVGNLTMTLVRPGYVRGRVTDTNGDPLVTHVAARYPEGWSFLTTGTVQVAFTDDTGAYELALPPGRFVVSAGSPGVSAVRALDEQRQRVRPGIGVPWVDLPDTDLVQDTSGLLAPPDSDGKARVYRRTFFPGRTDPSLASVVRVESGAQVDGVDIALDPVRAYRVAGRVVPAPGNGPDGIEVHIDNVGRVLAQPDGRFEFANVPAGTHDFRVVRQVGREQYSHGGMGYEPRVGSAWRRVVVDADRPDLRLEWLRTGVTVSGTIEYDASSTRMSAGPLALRSATPGDRWWLGTGVVSSGQFEFSDVPPGRFWFGMSAVHTNPSDEAGPEPRWLVKSVWHGGRDLQMAGLDVGAAPVTGIHLRVALADALVRGVVRDAAGSRVAGSQVLLFPVDAPRWAVRPQLDDPRIQRIQSKADGSFEFAPTVAGRYWVIAVTRIPAGGWPGPGVFEALASTMGREIEVTSGVPLTLDLPLDSPGGGR